MPGIIENSRKKVYSFGIETLQNVTYQGWEPGREYTKHIILKNVQVKTLKLQYKAPKTRFFTTLYPKTIVLSAGTSYTLPVTFRPLEKSFYEDNIQFNVSDEAFDIPISAVLPEFAISMPEEVRLPLVAVKDVAKMTFAITNKSELVTPFKWLTEEPFCIEPAEGHLEPFETYTLAVTFRPQAAQVHQCEALCMYGKAYECKASAKLMGSGKYPYLLLSCNGMTLSNSGQAELIFGSVPMGQSREKIIEITNESAVEAKFLLEQPSVTVGSLDTSFSCEKRGTIPPRGSVNLAVTYRPAMVNATSVDYFKLSSISGVGVATLKCVGTCEGPQFSLSINILNFSLIDVGSEATLCVELRNTSRASSIFQFVIDCNESVFKIEPAAGALDAKASQKCIVRFCPLHPINYYRRITCLVENQEPLFLDLLGTAHSETVKPAVLEVRHVVKFKTHSERGLTLFPPEVLNEMLTTKKLDLDANGCLMSLPAEAVEPYCDPALQASPVEHYFNDGHHSDLMYAQPHVSLDSINIDFGRCYDMKNIEAQGVTLTNHSKGKIVVQWMGDASHDFFITPSMVDIPPLKSASFRVNFKPNAPNGFYGAELECYCYYKSLRDYRLVEDITHMPPFCVTLTAAGSTFQPGHETFLPTIHLNSNPIVFPPVHAHEAAFRTLTVTNKGDRPVLFSIDNEESRLLSVKPCLGLVGPRGQQILTVRAMPSKAGIHRTSVHLKLNHDERNAEKVVACCSAETPELLLSNKGECFLRPTYVGAVSHRSYSLKNISRLPLSFEWIVPTCDRHVLSVQPHRGTILPNETQEHTLAFRPQRVEKYVLKPAVVVQHQAQSLLGQRKAFPVRVIGEGSKGEITAEQTYFDFGDVVVGSCVTRSIVLVNSGDCTLHYRLFIEQSVEGPYGDVRQLQGAIALQLNETEGSVPARSKKTVRGVVKALQRVSYRFAISYQLMTLDELNKGSITESDPVHLCDVLASGVFPQLRVTDARVHGSGVSMSKKQLWNLFQLDSFNMFLGADPSDKELMYSIATRLSAQRRPPVHTRAVVDFNFGAAPRESEPFYVTLQVENCGSVPSEWEFLYPNDLHMELEHWSETGELDEDEIHELKVMENKLFSVEPKKGKLQPGECREITLAYKHAIVGTDRLPVLLKLAHGREILLNFTGVTVEVGKPHIHFASSSHTFEPVCIGEKEAPKQIYELYNGGSIPVHYELDTLALDVLRQESFDHAIFECTNPKGSIAPGASAAIEWRFSPLEAKKYMVDVPVRTHNGDTSLITFIGVGYDKSIMGDTMPLNSEAFTSGVPNIQRAWIPGQKLSLSHERLSFGNLPLFCCSRKVLFLRNTSSSSVSYSWHITEERSRGIIDVAPANGTLGPHESVMLQASFSSTGAPGFYDIDLLCKVVDESSLAAYRNALRNWENELQRQRVEFTITEKDLNADQHLADLADYYRTEKAQGGDGASSTNASSSGIVVRPSAASEAYKSYKTLPPIMHSDAETERAAEADTIRLKTMLWEKPRQPEPFLLHLGITARTHGIVEFQETFPLEYSKFFVDRSLKAESTDRPKTALKNLTCMEAEKEVVFGVIGNVLRTLVDDTSFHAAIEDLENEAIPFFRQLGEKVATIVTAPSWLTSLDQRRARSAEERLRTPLGSGDLSPLTAPSQFEFEVTEVSSPSPRPAIVLIEDNKTSTFKGQSTLLQKERVLRSPAVALHLEDVLEKTILNVIQEAALDEFAITSRPRLVALPPNPKR